MSNILFALIAVGALCIDIVLNRSIIEEINDEIEEHINKIYQIYKDLKIPPDDKVIDKVKSLISKLENKAKESCASKNANFYYVTVLILSISVIISAIIDKLCVNFPSIIMTRVYEFFRLVGTSVWISILVFYVIRICCIIKNKSEIEGQRKKVKESIAATAANIKLIGGDASGPLD